ncbi:hypothetical protein B0H21DRAFT_866553 [Amylocystis lapponica]|nr:hypothetical protein B0H21DRAFT_866553 [Amylocystis lapponica]
MRRRNPLMWAPQAFNILGCKVNLKNATIHSTGRSGNLRQPLKETHLLSASFTSCSGSYGVPVYRTSSPRVSLRYQELSLAAPCSLWRLSARRPLLFGSTTHCLITCPPFKHTTPRSLKRRPTVHVITSPSSRAACTGVSSDVLGPPPALQRVRVVCAVHPLQFHDTPSVPQVTEPSTHTASQIPGLVSLSGLRAPSLHTAFRWMCQTFSTPSQRRRTSSGALEPSAIPRQPFTWRLQVSSERVISSVLLRRHRWRLFWRG